MPNSKKPRKTIRRKQFHPSGKVLAYSRGLDDMSLRVIPMTEDAYERMDSVGFSALSEIDRWQEVIDKQMWANVFETLVEGLVLARQINETTEIQSELKSGANLLRSVKMAWHKKLSRPAANIDRLYEVLDIVKQLRRQFQRHELIVANRFMKKDLDRLNNELCPSWQEWV